MASHKIRIRSAVTATLIAAQLGIANPIGVPHQYKAVGENMAVTLKNKEEKQQEKLAHDLYREYSKEKGIIHPQPAMFPKISENEYIEFIKEYNVKNKGEFLARLGEAAEKYRGGDINAGLANLRYGLADLTSSEKARQETLTPKEKRTEQRERASRDIKNTGIFKAIQESEGGVKIEVPEAPRIEVPVPTVKAEKPAEEELKPRGREAKEKPAEEVKAPAAKAEEKARETLVLPEQRIVGQKPAPEIKEEAIVPSRKEAKDAEKRVREEEKRTKGESKASERQAREQEKAEKRIAEDNKRRD